jgi:ribosome-associated protein
MAVKKVAKAEKETKVKAVKSAKAVKAAKTLKTSKVAKSVKNEKTSKAPKAVKTVKAAKKEKTAKPLTPEKEVEIEIEETGKITDALLIKYSKSLRSLLDEKKGENISLLDLRKVNSFLDYFIICTGTSPAHLRSMAKDVQRFFADKDIKLRGMSDLSSDWVVLDYSEIVIHLFSLEARGYYDLDKLWSDAVRL